MDLNYALFELDNKNQGAKWLRPDLKIRFISSSNKHGTEKADKIFTEIWQDSFSPCEN